MTQQEPKFDVAMLRAFDGPIHDLLGNIWDAAAEAYPQVFRLRVFPDQGSHQDGLELIWSHYYGHDRKLLITEQDVLPNLRTAFWSRGETWVAPAILVESYTRNPNNLKLIAHRGESAPWFVALDCSVYGQREFDWGGSRDPGTLLFPQIGESVIALTVDDGFPIHYGLETRLATHLFWSRHYNDEGLISTVAGFSLDAIMAGVRRRLISWYNRQPKKFRSVYEKRFGKFKVPGRVVCEATARHYAARSQASRMA